MKIEKTSSLAILLVSGFAHAQTDTASIAKDSVRTEQTTVAVQQASSSKSGFSVEVGANAGLNLSLSSDGGDDVASNSQDETDLGNTVKFSSLAYLNEGDRGYGVGAVVDLSSAEATVESSGNKATTKRAENFYGLALGFRNHLIPSGRFVGYGVVGLGLATAKLETEYAGTGTDFSMTIEGSGIGIYSAIGFQYRVLSFLSVVAEGYYLDSQLDEADVTLTTAGGSSKTTLSYEGDEGDASRYGLSAGLRLEFGRF